MRNARSLATIGAATLIVAACQDSVSPAPARHLTPASPSMSVAVEASAYSPQLDQIRQKFASTVRADVSLATAQISVAGDSAGWQGATTLIANNRTHINGAAFVPNDPRRGGGSDITYIIDGANESAKSRSFAQPTGFVMGPAEIEPEIDTSILRWQKQPSCGTPNIAKVPYTGADPDVVDGLVFGDASKIGNIYADITHGGWLPRAFFDALTPNGSQFILGVTFTFVFQNADGTPTDIDHDGLADAAFAEIWYNNRFFWTADPTFAFAVDIQSVVTHESGHAFGLDHFGKAFVDNKGFIKYAPRAVMTATYVSPFRDLTGSDNASFCQIWANN